MKKVIKDSPKDTVSSEFVSMSKIYIFSDEGGIYKLCKLGNFDEWSWVNINGTYTSRIEKYTNLQNAVESKLYTNLMEFDNFDDFVSYFINKIHKKCNHEYFSDGGNCIHCGKTVSELLEV